MISDAHAGLKAAVKAVLPGAGWQRSRVHFARTQTLGSAHSKPINALISTIFAQTSPETVRETYHQVTASLEATEHWKKFWSNNPIERCNTEIKRRADVVQVFLPAIPLELGRSAPLRQRRNSRPD